MASPPLNSTSAGWLNLNRLVTASNASNIMQSNFLQIYVDRQDNKSSGLISILLISLFLLV